MEASDTFGQGVEIGEGEDPFAGTDFGDFGEPEANGAAAEPTTELKTVNKEGDEVPAHAPADAASVESQTGEAAQPVPEGGAEPAIQTEPAAVAQNTQPVATEDESAAKARREEEARAYREAHSEGEYAPPKALEHQERLRAIAEREAAERASVPETHMTAGAERPTSPAESAGPTEDSDEEEAAPPAEPTDNSGKTTKRRYVVLKVVGPGKFEQVTWYEDGEGKMVAKGPGTKRQGIALARGAEDALKIGYVACGAPQDGVSLVAVAQLHFQPKPVKPAPPKPSSVRLQIG